MEQDQLPRKYLDEPLPLTNPPGLILKPKDQVEAAGSSSAAAEDKQLQLEQTAAAAVQAPDPKDLPTWKPKGGSGATSSGYNTASGTDSDPGLEQSLRRQRPWDHPQLNHMTHAFTSRLERAEAGERVQWGRKHGSGKWWDISDRGKIEQKYYRNLQTDSDRCEIFQISQDYDCLRRRRELVRTRMEGRESTRLYHWATETEPIMWPREFMEQLFFNPAKQSKHILWIGGDRQGTPFLEPDDMHQDDWMPKSEKVRV